MPLSLHDQSRCLVFIHCPVPQSKKENLWAESQGRWTCNCCTEQKVKSLSKHMPRLSSRPIISKSLCASPAWAAAAPLCLGENWGQARTKRELRQSFACKMHTEAARERETEDMFTEVSLSHITPMRRQFIVRNRAVLLCQPSESYETWLSFDVALAVLQSDQ